MAEYKTLTGFIDHSRYEVIDVDCCVCGATGKVEKLVFWQKDCSVCSGSGQRPILLSKDFSPIERSHVLTSALYPQHLFGPRPTSLTDTLGLGFLDRIGR